MKIKLVAILTASVAALQVLGAAFQNLGFDGANTNGLEHIQGGNPFEIKRQIIKLVVNQITVDTREQWIRVEGAISKTYALVSVAGTNRSKLLQTDQSSHIAPIDITSNHIPRRA